MVAKLVILGPDFRYKEVTIAKAIVPKTASNQIGETIWSQEKVRRKTLL